MPKTKRPRRPGLTERPTSSAAVNSSNGSRSTGADRRQAQGIAPEDAELILNVLRELRRGNLSVRMPLITNGTMGKIAAEINGIIELNERNAKNLSGVARVIGAVAEGDLFQTMELDLDGRPLEVRHTLVRGDRFAVTAEFQGRALSLSSERRSSP